MRVVQCSWEEMQKEQRLFCEPHRMAFKNNGHFFKNNGHFGENDGHFFKNKGHFFSIFREEERKKRKNGELKRNEKKKNLIRYFANHYEFITFAAYNL